MRDTRANTTEPDMDETNSPEGTLSASLSPMDHTLLIGGSNRCRQTNQSERQIAPLVAAEVALVQQSSAASAAERPIQEC